ncbi:DCC-interacting protein 13-beta [Heterocephalus glaber]|uniref:DCC-interacting protein 13-beta n=1 Tax=Heterocephalus glaber TaxID=10181 RepID=G5C463_HETGA|nr:DCC-interacting protein 13-beta [Heterocephalus glaber]
MPSVDKLLLEEALQDSPQTRSLLSVFEEDAGTLTVYTNELLQAMQRVYGAQNEMCLATQQLSKQLLAYEKQNFALGKGDEEVISTLHCFSKVVEELNALHTELAKQLADTMVLPIIQFREKDLTEVSTLKDLFGLASDDHDLAMAKYSRLPKKKENEKVKAEVRKEVAAARQKQHLSSLQYYCALNALQYRKQMAMMEPMIGFAREQRCGVGPGPVTDLSPSVGSIQVELEAEAEKMRVSQQELLSVDESVYTPDFDVAAPEINRNLIQKAGYLNLRNKTGLVSTSWERLYFFTQGGNLLCQPRGAVAGGLIQDLDNCSVMAVDCEDRRYCFQITAPNGKSGIILQAESRKENEEWICAINNISRQIYLTEDPEAVAIRLNQTALQAVTPITSLGKKQESSSPSQNLKNPELENDKTVPRAAAEVPEAEELITPGTPIQFDIMLPATEFLDQNRGSRRTNPFGESEDDSFPEVEDSLLQQMFIVRFLGSMAVKTDSTAEVIYEAMRQVLAARAIHNIFRMTESHLLVTSQALRRTNPFGESEDDSFPEVEDSLLQQMFIVRFLGSMAVKTDSTAEVIYEAMRQVLAARAIHNIFRMTESHLLVTSQALSVSLSPQFELTSVTQFAAHQENRRLFGFVVRMPESTGGESLSAYIFESNSEGEKICYAVNLGKEIIEVQKAYSVSHITRHSVLQHSSSHGRQDPEALAQLMLSVPLTNDGKYVLLTDQAEGSPRGNQGAESEA